MIEKIIKKTMKTIKFFIELRNNICEFFLKFF